MNYLMYCRKSSEEETKQVQSLDTQERLLSDFANKLNLTVIDVIREKKSAKDDGNRPLFNDMLARINKGEADGVLVIHTDRLARNLIEAGQIIKLIEQKRLTEVRTPTNLYNTPQSLLYMGFDFLFAAQYSRDLSVKVKAGIESKLLRGEYPAWAPTGYFNKDAKIYPDPIQAPFIRVAFDLYSTGMHSLKEVTNILYDRGFRTRRAQKKVTKSVIFRILKDPIYCGMIKRKDVLYSGVHTPIIPKALFDKVQQVFIKSTRPLKRKHEFLYRNYMTCAYCGCKLTAVTKKGHIYYYCTNGRGNCAQHRKYLKASEVQDLLHGLFSFFAIQGDLADLSLRAYANDLRKQHTSGITSVSSLQTHITSTTERLDRLLDALLEKRIDGAKYDLKQKELLSEKATAETQLKQLNPQDPEVTLEQLEKVKNKAVSLAKVFFEGDDVVKSELLNSALWNVSIQNKTIASQQYKFPYNHLWEMSKSDDIAIWRRRQDSNLRGIAPVRFPSVCRSRWATPPEALIISSFKSFPVL